MQTNEKLISYAFLFLYTLEVKAQEANKREEQLYFLLESSRRRAEFGVANKCFRLLGESVKRDCYQ